MRCGVIALLVGALLAAVAACSGSSETYALEPTEACLGARGVEVVGFSKKPETNKVVDPYRATQGSLLVDGVVPVHILFGKDAAEGEAMAERLEDYQYLDGFEGREHRMEVRRRGNAVLGADVHVDAEYYDPPADEVGEALDGAEECLTHTQDESPAGDRPRYFGRG
jgi:hypothetical protein